MEEVDPEKWVKLHIAIDAETQKIVAEVTTESTVADSSMTKRQSSFS